MPQILFIEADGVEHAVTAPVGQSLMHAAIAAGVPGIIGECGGSCSCATCHVYLEPADLFRVPPMEPGESDMLDFAASPREPGSRLGCQVIVTSEMDRLRVRVPETQV